MKIHVKKKLYQAKMQAAAAKGLVNDEQGRMVERLDERNKAMERDYFAGYKLR